jgi:hypothetical protein
MSPLTPEQEKELANIFAANRARQEALSKKERMEAGEVEIFLMNSPDDPPVFSPENQAELQSVLHAFRREGIEATPLVMRTDSADAAGGFIGEFLIPFIQASAPTVGVIVAAWIHGRLGRKARIEVGDTKVEATTVEEVDKLLKLAAQHHEHLSKRIPVRVK